MIDVTGLDLYKMDPRNADSLVDSLAGGHCISSQYCPGVPSGQPVALSAGFQVGGSDSLPSTDQC